MVEEFDLLADLGSELAAALTDRPPAVLADGDVIRPGFDAELDELRDLRDGGKQYIATLQQRERERTGIPSLKVGYNKVFGYYLEVTNAHAGKVPADYERRQTLTGAERYVTPELKDYEARVLGAEEKIGQREAELFGQLRERVGGATARSAADRLGAGAARRLGVACRDGGAAPLRAAGGARRSHAHPPAVPASGDRAADAARGVHPQRRPFRSGGTGAARHRPQHGRARAPSSGRSASA